MLPLTIEYYINPKEFMDCPGFSSFYKKEYRKTILKRFTGLFGPYYSIYTDRLKNDIYDKYIQQCKKAIDFEEKRKKREEEGLFIKLPESE